MTKANLKLIPLKNEYVSLVFYFSTPPDMPALGRAMHRLIRCALENAHPPAADLDLYPEDILSPRDPIWVLGGPAQIYSHTVRGIAPGNENGLDILLDLPAETARMAISRERRDSETKEWMLIWSINYTPPAEPTGTEYFALDARLQAHFHVTLFAPEEVVWNEEDPDILDAVNYDPRARALVDGFLDVMGGMDGVYTGNVEVVYESETARGLYYSNPSVTQRKIPWHRQIEHALWANAGDDRHNFVRRVSWGNFLGPHIAKRLDPDGSWIEKFKCYRTNPNMEYVGEQWSRRFENGSLFLAVSENPLHVSQWDVPGIGLIQAPWITAAWLHREFNKAGILL